MKQPPFIVWIVILIQGSVALNAQPNLVPNPSFEIFDTCPSASSLICNAVPWFQPHKNSNGVCLGGSSSTDYFHACSTWLVGVPINFLGHQNARTDNAYAGFYTRQDSTNALFDPEYREYLEVKLLDSLTGGKKYCVTFYVSHADSSNIAVASIGAYFSRDTLLDTTANYHFVPAITPDVVNGAVYIMDENNWTEISGVLTATGGERFMTIGNFAIDANTPYINVHSYSNSNSRGAYYYIDDVSVIEMLQDSLTPCGYVGIEEIKKEGEVLLFPNPVTNELRVQSSKFKAGSIEIYNAFGEKIFQSINQPLNNSAIDLSSQRAGIYFLTLKEKESRSIGTRKFVISR